MTFPSKIPIRSHFTPHFAGNHPHPVASPGPAADQGLTEPRSDPRMEVFLTQKNPEKWRLLTYKDDEKYGVV